MIAAKMEKPNFIMRVLFVLLPALCNVWPTVQALQLNLTESCANTQISYCALANIKTTLQDPLNVVNATAPQLYELVLRNSVLTRIPRLLLAQAPALRSFFMYKCELNRLNAYDFPTGYSLSSLVLQKNNFPDVPEKAFASIDKLEELQLGHNMIHMVHKNAFAGLGQLRYLDLQQNDIRELPKTLFDDLVNLVHIDLSSNDIEKIDDTTFKSNSKLQTLLLGDNRFSLFEPNALEHLPWLHMLDISNSAVKELRLQSVDTLLAQGSTLQRIAIAGGAVKVHAGNNQLTKLSIGNKLPVRELDLHGNQLESLEDFIGMLNLQRLDVSHNQLHSLRTPQSPLYLPLPNLVHLNLASNQLQNLTLENFLKLQKLTHLDLAFNHLLRLDQRIFEPLSNLEKFYIEGNLLHTFDYQQFASTHECLKEVGIFENEWKYSYMRTMIACLQEHNIQLPVRLPSNNYNSNNNVGNQQESTLNSLSAAANGSRHRNASTAGSLEDFEDLHGVAAASDVQNVSGIHPYWTMRDVCTVVLLLLVLLILLLQLFSFLREEECVPTCLNRFARNTGHRNESRRLVEEEEDSEV